MAEEMMSDVDIHDDVVNNSSMSNNNKIKKYLDSHYSKSYFQFDKKKMIVNRPICIIYSLEESVRANGDHVPLFSLLTLKK